MVVLSVVLSVMLGGEGLVRLAVCVVHVLPSVSVLPAVGVLPSVGVGVDGVMGLAGLLVHDVVEGLGAGVRVVVEGLRGVVVVVPSLSLGVRVVGVRLEEHVRQDVSESASREESDGRGEVSELHDGGVVGSTSEYTRKMSGDIAR